MVLSLSFDTTIHIVILSDDQSKPTLIHSITRLLFYWSVSNSPALHSDSDTCFQDNTDLINCQYLHSCPKSWFKSSHSLTASISLFTLTVHLLFWSSVIWCHYLVVSLCLYLSVFFYTTKVYFASHSMLCWQGLCSTQSLKDPGWLIGCHLPLPELFQLRQTLQPHTGPITLYCIRLHCMVVLPSWC